MSSAFPRLPSSLRPSNLSTKEKVLGSILACLTISMLVVVIVLAVSTHRSVKKQKKLEATVADLHKAVTGQEADEKATITLNDVKAKSIEAETITLPNGFTMSTSMNGTQPQLEIKNTAAPMKLKRFTSGSLKGKVESATGGALVVMPNLVANNSATATYLHSTVAANFPNANITAYAVTAGSGRYYGIQGSGSAVPYISLDGSSAAISTNGKTAQAITLADPSTSSSTSS